MLKFALYDYVPQRFIDRSSFEQQDTNRMILDFKDGRNYASRWAAQSMAYALHHADLKDVVIACVPASSTYSHARRYKRFCAANLLCSVPPAYGMDSLMAICDGSWRREHDCIRHTPPTCPWQHRHVSARHSKPPAFCTMLAGWGTSLGNGSTLLPCLSVSLRYVLAMTADVCVGWTWQVDTARMYTNSGTYSAWQVGQVACGA